MRIVQSGARSSLHSDLRHGKWEELESWDKYAQRVISHVADDSEVRFLAVIDGDGLIVAHNNEEKIGTHVLPDKLTTFLKQKFDQPGSAMYTIAESAEGGRVFEAVRGFKPLRSMIPPMMTGSWRSTYMEHHGSHHMQFDFEQRSELLGPVSSDPLKDYYIIAGLDMTEYDRALGRLRLQVIGLSFTMLLVGVGGWFSLATVQGYRVSQRTIREMQVFTGQLVTNLPVGIIATDKQGHITTWNGMAGELTGLSFKDAAGKRPSDILPSELKDFFPSPAKREHGSDGQEIRKKEISIKVAGSMRVLLGQSVPIRDGETEFMGRVLLLSNLTELKNMEKAARENERLAAVGRMAAGVAHEVRNPLSSIKGLALLLKGKVALNTEGSETVTLLIREVERMNKTISELLGFARPAPLRLESVNLAELLGDCLKLISPDVINHNVKASLNVDRGVRPVAADRDRLQQVFLNILLNGVQAMEDGGELRVDVNNNENNMVGVIVTDTGCGISEENLGQIFFPYFTTKQGGTGIGLAISQKIVSEHGGEINVRSELGKGTVVAVGLPIG